MSPNPEADEGFSLGHLGSDHPVMGWMPEGERGPKKKFQGKQKNVVLFRKRGS